MEKTVKIARVAGKAFLVLLGGVLMPVLIWVALGAAVTWKAREKRVKHTPVRRIGELLAAARS